jgi:hypothetical protein
MTKAEHENQTIAGLASRAALVAMADAGIDHADAIYIGNMLSKDATGQAHLGPVNPRRNISKLSQPVSMPGKLQATRRGHYNDCNAARGVAVANVTCSDCPPPT